MISDVPSGETFSVLLGVFFWCPTGVIALSLVFCVVFCRLLFLFCSFYFWPKYCLSFDLRPLIFSTFLVICIILVLSQRVDDLNHHLNIRLDTMSSQDILKQ